MYILALSLALFACEDDGGDESGDGNAGGANGDEQPCNTPDDPMTFELADVQPAAGSEVPNEGITHQFVIRNASAIPTGVIFTFSPTEHEAGTPTEGSLMFTIAPDASGDVSFTSEDDQWTNAPGRVRVDTLDVYQDPNSGCYFRFPAPLFEYTVTAP